jgi:hypothetical protein
MTGELDDAVVFDWDPSAPMASGAPRHSAKGGKRHLGPRGTDSRLSS